ncbi:MULTISPECIES: hypothetical protein [unclassified Nocardioides]|uniref:hypothetical protein n=1 Tax=unclassified Nocardioides TaxID=2615069 RepID=UPI0009EFF6FE|nr:MULTISPECIES: hypothetical protein [unclassified Nocardioides]GAW52547.1 uncharacterized protein PD653B2_4905 [Nocardioides sp. PD653-B2]GAW55569.1 uncharacterized protein PD653_2994 [Nocardioides sp. PD653]
MPIATTYNEREGYDSSPDFVYVISLIAALIGATGHPEQRRAAPFLGMAEAELVDFGQRRPTHYVAIQIDDFRASLAELEDRMTALMTDSQILQHTLRIDSALRFLHRATSAIAA